MGILESGARRSYKLVGDRLDESTWTQGPTPDVYRGPRPAGEAPPTRWGQSIRRSRMVLSDLVLHNASLAVGSLPRPRFFTLTFADRVFDYDEAHAAWHACWRRMRRSRMWTAYGYVVVPERHESGAWHLHGILFGQRRFRGFSEALAEVWGLGFVHYRTVIGNRHAAYISKYVGSVDVPPDAKSFWVSRGLPRPPRVSSADALGVVLAIQARLYKAGLRPYYFLDPGDRSSSVASYSLADDDVLADDVSRMVSRKKGACAP